MLLALTRIQDLEAKKEMATMWRVSEKVPKNTPAEPSGDSFGHSIDDVTHPDVNTSDFRLNMASQYFSMVVYLSG